MKNNIFLKIDYSFLSTHHLPATFSSILASSALESDNSGILRYSMLFESVKEEDGSSGTLSISSK